MEKNELELEQEINNSPLYSISGDNMEEVQKKEKYKLAENLIKYSKFYWNYIKNGLEIHESIEYCIKKYDPQEGKFTHFFKNRVRWAIFNHGKPEIKQDKIKKSTRVQVEADIEQSESNNVDNLIEKKQYLDVIERAFIKKQDRIKPYISALFTIRLFDFLLSFDFSDKHYKWIDYALLEKYKNVKKKPKQKEIAAQFGRLEEDASRTVQRFVKSIKKSQL